MILKLSWSRLRSSLVNPILSLSCLLAKNLRSAQTGRDPCLLSFIRFFILGLPLDLRRHVVVICSVICYVLLMFFSDVVRQKGQRWQKREGNDRKSKETRKNKNQGNDKKTITKKSPRTTNQMTQTIRKEMTTRMTKNEEVPQNGKQWGTTQQWQNMTSKWQQQNVKSKWQKVTNQLTTKW